MASNVRNRVNDLNSNKEKIQRDSNFSLNVFDFQAIDNLNPFLSNFILQKILLLNLKLKISFYLEKGYQLYYN